MYNFEAMKTTRVRQEGGTTVIEFPIIEENGDEMFADVFYDAKGFEWRWRVSGRAVSSDSAKAIEDELARREFERAATEGEA